MHSYDPATLRGCCITIFGEEHASYCNRARDRRMIAAADARVRDGMDTVRAARGVDWAPVARTVDRITMWDAPDDATATVALADATGDVGAR